MWWNIANVSTTCIRSYFSAKHQHGKFVILQVLNQVSYRPESDIIHLDKFILTKTTRYCYVQFIAEPYMTVVNFPLYVKLSP
jgi:hypothetical protein